MKNVIKVSLVVFCSILVSSCANMSKSKQIDQVINSATYPLKPVDDIDSVLFIKAAAQGVNEIKYCNYSEARKERINHNNELIKQVFLKPSAYGFNREQIDRFIEKEASAQYKEEGKVCFNNNNSESEFNKKFDSYDESLKEFIQRARNY